MKKAVVIEKHGPLYPDGYSTIYRLMAGARGYGRELYRHEARGDVLAHDAALDGCYAKAFALGIEVVDIICQRCRAMVARCEC